MVNNKELREIRKYILNPQKDYRRELSKFRVSSKGDLQSKSDGGQWETIVPKGELTDPNLISEMNEGKSDFEYGQMTRAVFKALEMRGIHQVTINLFNHHSSFKFADGK